MQIIAAAIPLVVKQGYLPLSVEQLARAAGTSKALIYTYFPTQYALFNALIEQELNGLAAAGLDTASQVNNLQQAALLCGMLYFEHIARSGLLLHILMADRYMAGHIEPRLRRMRNGILQRLGKLAYGKLPLSRKEILAAMEMMLSIPEEAGRLAFNGELPPNIARELCHSLILSSLEALHAPERVLDGA